MATIEIFYIRNRSEIVITDIIDEVKNISKKVGDKNYRIITEFDYVKKDGSIGQLKKASYYEFYMRAVPCGK